MHTLSGHVQFIVTCLVFLCFLNSLTCETSNSNCLNYQQTNKENLRNCLRDKVNKHTFNVSQQRLKDNLNASLSELEAVVDAAFKKKTWKIDVCEWLELRLDRIDDTNLSINLHTKDNVISERKMKMSMQKIMPYAIVPGLLMAGILPWVLPGLKMVVMTVSMVNQMAFNAAFFALVRSYIFDTEKEEHVVYINHGYKKKQPHHRRR